MVTTKARGEARSPATHVVTKALKGRKRISSKKEDGPEFRGYSGTKPVSKRQTTINKETPRNSGGKKSGRSEPKKLPPCPGPQLQQFPHHDSKIKWLERLDTDRDDIEVQGYVFHVKIKSKEYALKVFKDFDVETMRPWWETFLGKGQDPETMEYYLNPFFRECRAYGAIQDALANKTLKANPSVPCYGWIILTREDEKVLEDQGIYLDANNSDSDDNESTVEKFPARALVKKYVSKESGVTARRQAKIYRNIQDLNAIGVYNMDIREDNYMDGLLVDFGSSVTEPDMIVNGMTGGFASYKKNVYTLDEARFKDMVKDKEFTKIFDPDTFKQKAASRTRRENAGKPNYVY